MRQGSRDRQLGRKEEQITEKNEDIAQLNLERKAKKKKKLEDENRNSVESAEAGVEESEN